MCSEKLKITECKHIYLLVSVLKHYISILNIHTTSRLFQSAEIYDTDVGFCFLTHGSCMLVIIVENCNIIHGLVLGY